MRTVIVALVSFMLGATLVSLYGYQTSTQPGVPAIHVEGAAPVVPTVGTVVLNGSTVTGAYEIDGLQCMNCKFTNVDLIYGGGAYRFENPTVIPPVSFRFTGAAANTFALLDMFRLIGCPAAAPKPGLPNPNTPILKKANLKLPIRVNIVSPFGQK